MANLGAMIVGMKMAAMEASVRLRDQFSTLPNSWNEGYAIKLLNEIDIFNKDGGAHSLLNASHGKCPIFEFVRGISNELTCNGTLNYTNEYGVVVAADYSTLRVMATTIVNESICKLETM